MSTITYFSNQHTPKDMRQDKFYTTIDGQEYKVSFSYSLGGMNYFTGDRIPRGYHVAVLPVTRKFENGWASESSVMSQGLRNCVLEAKAFSAKKFETLCKTWQEDHATLVTGMIDRCIEKGWTTEK